MPRDWDENPSRGSTPLFHKECQEQFRTALAGPKGKRQETFIIPHSPPAFILLQDRKPAQVAGFLLQGDRDENPSRGSTA